MVGNIEKIQCTWVKFSKKFESSPIKIVVRNLRRYSKHKYGSYPQRKQGLIEPYFLFTCCTILL